MSLEVAFEVGRLYKPIKDIADTFAAAGGKIFTSLPGIEGYFPGGSVDGSARSVNLIDDGENLGETGTCPIGYDGQSYREVGDGTSYLYNDGAFEITGTETHIASAIRGLTLGGWFKVTDGPASVPSGIMGKFGPVTDYGYLLLLATDDKPWFSVSGTGSAQILVEGPDVLVDDSWHFLAGRYKPSTEIAIWLDGAKEVNTVVVPSTLNVASEFFEVGRFAGNNSYIQELLWRDIFICQAALSDDLIDQIRLTSLP